MLSLSFVVMVGGVWWADRTLDGDEPTEPAALTDGREQIREAVEHGDCAALRRNIVRWRDGLDSTPPGTPAHDIPALLSVEATDAHRELGCRSSAVDHPVREAPTTGSTRVAYL